jgi:hypothetical protein
MKKLIKGEDKEKNYLFQHVNLLGLLNEIKNNGKNIKKKSFN